MGWFAKALTAALLLYMGYGLAGAVFGFGIPKLYSQKSSIKQAATGNTGTYGFVYVKGSKYRGHPRGGGLHSGK
jgi:hypothetical protein